MTRVFLAAGVAALAIAAPASAGPGGGHGKDRQAQVVRQGGGERAAAIRGGIAAQRVERRAVAAPRMERQQFAAPRMERQQRFAAIERPQRVERMQMRAERPQLRMQRVAPAQTRIAERQQMRANRQQVQNRLAQRQQMRADRQQVQSRLAQRQQMQTMRAQRMQQVQGRMAQQEQLRANRQQQIQTRMGQQQTRANTRQQVQAQMALRQQLQASRALSANVNNRFAVNSPVTVAQRQQQAAVFRNVRAMAPDDRVAVLRGLGDTRFTTVDVAPSRQILAPLAASALIGVPLTSASTVAAFSPLPATASFLFPQTPNYFYQYGNGYVYQVDRGTNLIDALFPLLAGGFLPGSFLPSPYMNSFVPSSYGFNSFYPDNGNICYRYGSGVIYEVDCFSGLVMNVIPMYAGGYGVGQMLPSAYNYYNVPMQYRSLYYPTADSSYWYAPGAIYQYDPSSSLITSVAALMSPGLTIGQPLPVGYNAYNVPFDYRSTYYDTPDAWYRYNNGYIYQVDPTTQLVTAIVASLLT